MTIWVTFISITILNEFTFGYTTFNLVISLLGGTYFYFAIQGLPLLIRLSRYHLKLYAADPSSSEVIDRLSDLLSYGVYIVALFAAALTLQTAAFGQFNQWNLIIIVIIGWIPTIAFFIANQYTLNNIIARAKWQTLNGVQAQIEGLQTQEAILSEPTLVHIHKLMDYHDRIKGTKNSALDLRSSLNFLNSLLLQHQRKSDKYKHVILSEARAKNLHETP